MNNCESESNCTHQFVETIDGTPVTFYIIKMTNCLFVWIGNKGTFENLAVAMKTKYSNTPIASSIMGHFDEDYSSSLAIRLSKMTEKQVFASFNISKVDQNVVLAINKRLMEELSKHPEMF